MRKDIYSAPWIPSELELSIKELAENTDKDLGGNKEYNDKASEYKVDCILGCNADIQAKYMHSF